MRGCRGSALDALGRVRDPRLRDCVALQTVPSVLVVNLLPVVGAGI